MSSLEGLEVEVCWHLQSKVSKAFDVSAAIVVLGSIQKYKSYPQPGLFIPTKSKCAARVIAEHVDALQVEELAGYLLVRIS